MAHSPGLSRTINGTSSVDALRESAPSFRNFPDARSRWPARLRCCVSVRIFCLFPAHGGSRSPVWVVRPFRIAD